MSKDKNLEYLTGIELEFVCETTEDVLGVEPSIEEDGCLRYPEDQQDEFNRIYDVIANNYILWKHEPKSELDFIFDTTELILDVDLCVRYDGYVGYPEDKADEFKRVYDIVANSYILWKHELKNQDNGQ